MATIIGKQALAGFEFNIRAGLNAVLFAPFALDESSGQVEILNFLPADQLSAPEGATHVSLTSASVLVDFDTGASEIELSPITNLPINLIASDVDLTPNNVPAGSGNTFYLLLIEFYQEMNGVQYALNNGAHNVLSILSVT